MLWVKISQFEPVSRLGDLYFSTNLKIGDLGCESLSYQKQAF